MSWRWLACICRMRPMRSRLSFTELYTVVPACTVPEYTRKKHSLPTNGSVAILNASAENGASSEDGRLSLLLRVGVHALDVLHVRRGRACSPQWRPAASARPCSCRTCRTQRARWCWRWSPCGWPPSSPPWSALRRRGTSSSVPRRSRQWPR